MDTDTYEFILDEHEFKYGIRQGITGRCPSDVVKCYNDLMSKHGIPVTVSIDPGTERSNNGKDYDTEMLSLINGLDYDKAKLTIKVNEYTGQRCDDHGTSSSINGLKDHDNSSIDIMIYNLINRIIQHRQVDLIDQILQKWTYIWCSTGVMEQILDDFKVGNPLLPKFTNAWKDRLKMCMMVKNETECPWWAKFCKFTGASGMDASSYQIMDMIHETAALVFKDKEFPEFMNAPEYCKSDKCSLKHKVDGKDRIPLFDQFKDDIRRYNNQIRWDYWFNRLKTSKLIIEFIQDKHAFITSNEIMVSILDALFKMNDLESLIDVFSHLITTYKQFIEFDEQFNRCIRSRYPESVTLLFANHTDKNHKIDVLYQISKDRRKEESNWTMAYLM